MSVMEEWSKPFPKIEIIDCKTEYKDSWIWATAHQREKYPYAVHLVCQSEFFDRSGNSIILPFKDDIVEWLAGKEYFHPKNYAILMFSNKCDLMEFKLRWG